MISKVTVRLALALGATLGCLVASELTLRAMFGDRALAMEPRLRTGPLVYEPNQVTRYRHREWDIEIRINSAGFRDEEACPRRGPDDVVVLGDSFVEGVGVEADRTIARRLESLLGARGGRRHVYNAGHYGTGPKQYIGTYRAHFRSRVPHSQVVIGVYVGNDLVTASTPDVLPVPDRGSPAFTVKVFLGEHSALYNLVNEKAKRSWPLMRLMMGLGLMAPLPAVPESFVYRPEAVADQAAYTCGLIADFVREVERDGKRCLVALIATREQVEDSDWNAMPDTRGAARFGLNARMATRLAALGVRVIDLAPGFVEASRRGRRLHFRTDRHWNPDGHDLAARILAPALELPSGR